MVVTDLYPNTSTSESSKFIEPHTRWITTLAFYIIAISLSAFNTFEPIIQRMKLKSYKSNKMLGLADYIIKVLQVALHILFASVVVYLIRDSTILTNYFIYMSFIYMSSIMLCVKPLLDFNISTWRYEMGKWTQCPKVKIWHTTNQFLIWYNNQSHLPSYILCSKFSTWFWN